MPMSKKATAHVVSQAFPDGTWTSRAVGWWAGCHMPLIGVAAALVGLKALLNGTWTFLVVGWALCVWAARRMPTS
ncbi:hypothetical protein GCM10027589_36410 [Actinocorallia lasiicapitis]